MLCYDFPFLSPYDSIGCDQLSVVPPTQEDDLKYQGTFLLSDAVVVVGFGMCPLLGVLIDLCVVCNNKQYVDDDDDLSVKMSLQFDHSIEKEPIYFVCHGERHNNSNNKNMFMAQHGTSSRCLQYLAHIIIIIRFQDFNSM